MKPEQRLKTRELRQQGLSIKTIAKIVGVSSGSVSKWTRDIELSPEQVKTLEQQNPAINGQMLGAKARSDNARATRLSFQEEGKIKAKEGNKLHQSGCMLYWGEGNKSKNSCGLVNSDVNVLKLYIRFLRECFNVNNNDIIIKMNCYTNNGLSFNQIEDYWLKELDLDRSSLRKGQENNKPRSVTNAVRHNKLPYGMCTVLVHSTHIVQHIFGAIQEYGGFNNNYMLM
jgi:transcriptional regulator with XRE-family HTH domain